MTWGSARKSSAPGPPGTLAPTHRLLGDSQQRRRTPPGNQAGRAKSKPGASGLLCALADLMGQEGRPEHHRPISLTKGGLSRAHDRLAGP